MSSSEWRGAAKNAIQHTGETDPGESGLILDHRHGKLSFGSRDSIVIVHLWVDDRFGDREACHGPLGVRSHRIRRLIDAKGRSVQVVDEVVCGVSTGANDSTVPRGMEIGRSANAPRASQPPGGLQFPMRTPEK